MDVQRILRNTPATLNVTFYTDESPTDADSSVTVTVKRADGSTLATGSAAHQGTGQYAYNLAGQANLNLLQVDWTGTFSSASGTITTFAEIVGGHFFTVAELRGFDASLADTTKYSTQALRDARLQVEVEFERVCKRAFVPRFGRDTIEGDGSNLTILSHPEPLVIKTVDGAAATDADYRTDGLRELYWKAGYFTAGQDYTIEYEYGMTRVPPDIKRAALRRARGVLVQARSRIDERATLMQVPDFGTFNLATPGKNGSNTGIPDIDVVLDAYALGNAGVL